MNYPSTRTLAEAGFVDAYRRVHPDEMQNPGYTWPTVEAAEEMGREDRIDFILFRGQGVTVHAAETAEISLTAYAVQDIFEYWSGKLVSIQPSTRNSMCRPPQ